MDCSILAKLPFAKKGGISIIYYAVMISSKILADQISLRYFTLIIY
jgi:hypothetical protein